MRGWLRCPPYSKTRWTITSPKDLCTVPPQNPQNAPLPHDNADALVLLCSLVYHKVARKGKKPLSIDELFHLAQLADEYECTASLSLQIFALLDAHFWQGLDRDWRKAVLRAATAYLFKQAKFFQAATFDLITKYNRPFSEARQVAGSDELPTAAFLIMSETRARGQQSVTKTLGEGGTCGGCGLQLEKDGYIDVVKSNFQLASWPPGFQVDGGETIADFIERMRELEELDIADSCSTRKAREKAGAWGCWTWPARWKTLVEDYAWNACGRTALSWGGKTAGMVLGCEAGV